MEDFRSHDIPLSVCIIDMDWHITKTGNASLGWTCYTWNRKLFPDPEGPMRTTTSPCPICRSTFSSTTVFPNRLVTPANSIIYQDQPQPE